MSRSLIIFAALALASPTFAAELPKSGKFGMPTGWKAVGETIQAGNPDPKRADYRMLVTACTGASFLETTFCTSKPQSRDVSVHQRENWKYRLREWEMCVERWRW
jgi:hypothetical protein